MKHKGRAAVLLAVLIVASCATKYQNSGFTGGFTDTQLGPDIFRVAFSGNAFTSSDRVQDFALLRAAELCLKEGFRYFVVLDTANRSITGTYVAPSTAQTTGTVTAYGNTATYSGTTTYTPGQAYHYYKPGVGLMIRAFTDRPEGTAFDASFLVGTLRAKYGIR